MSKSKPAANAALERLLRKWPHNRDKVSFGEALALLDEVDLTLDAAKDNPEMYQDLTGIRSHLLGLLDAEAKEIGMAEKWEELKKGKSTLGTMDKLLAAKEGIQFFDAFRDVSTEQRAALEEAGVNLREVKGLEPLAEAVRQDSQSKMVLALLKSAPGAALKLIARHFWPPVSIALVGLVFLWAGYRTVGGGLILVAIIYAVDVAVK